MKLWVFVADHEFSDRLITYFDVPALVNSGYVVEIWVLRFKGVRESRPHTPRKNVHTTYLDTLESLEARVATLGENDVITAVSAFATQNQGRDAEVRNALRGAKTLIAFDEHTAKYFHNTSWAYLRLLVSNLRFWSRAVREAQPLLSHAIGIRIPSASRRLWNRDSTKLDFIFSLGAPACHSLSTIKNRSGVKTLPLIRAKEKVCTHERAYQDKEPFILLSDSGHNFHTDWEKLSRGVQASIYRREDPDIAAACVRKVAAYLTTFHRYQLMIAPHPNANYPEGFFAHWQVATEDTVNLLESPFLALMVSFGSSLAVTAHALGVPQAIVDKEQGILPSLASTHLARKLKLPLWRLSKPTVTWKLPDGFPRQSKANVATPDSSKAFIVSRPHHRTALALECLDGRRRAI